MLARLLRRLLLIQFIAGGVLGVGMANYFDISPWWALVVALLAPSATLKLTLLSAAIRSRRAGSARLWWRAVIGENWVGWRLTMLQMPWTWRSPQTLPAKGAPKGLPVVLVHGYICNHRIWDTLSKQLRAAGHPVLSVNLEPLFAPIDDYAVLVEHAVQQLCEATGVQRVALVGHSMGGLAIRAWMRAHGVSRAVRVITLGTPHAGTRIDPYPLTPNSLQMAWQSDWLQHLAASETPTTRALMRIALTPQDEIVYPQLEQVLPGVPIQIFEGLGHIELCYNAAVLAWVQQELAVPGHPG